MPWLCGASTHCIVWSYAVFIEQSPRWCHKKQKQNKEKSNSLFVGLNSLTNVGLYLPFALFSTPPMCVVQILLYQQITLALGPPSDSKHISDYCYFLWPTDSGRFLWPTVNLDLSHLPRETESTWSFPVSLFSFPMQVTSRLFILARSLFSNLCWLTSQPSWLWPCKVPPLSLFCHKLHGYIYIYIQGGTIKLSP